VFKVIIKTSFLYYVFAFILAYGSIDFHVLYSLRLSYLIGYSSATRPIYKVVIWDYITHLAPQDGEFWCRLAANYALAGDYANAIRAYHKAISIEPREKSYQRALLYCYQLQKSNSIK